MPRNLELEKVSIGDFGKRYGRLPNTPQDWAEVHKMAYGSDMPAEFQAEVQAPATESLAATGVTPAGGYDYTGALQAAGTRMQQAGAAYGQYQQPTAALGTFQSALQTLSKAKEAPLGESKIFGMAGVQGYGALSASLSARTQELKASGVAYENIISSMTGAYKDQASALRDEYDRSQDQYNEAIKNIIDREKDLLDYDKAFKLLDIQNAHDKEMELWKTQLVKDEIDPNTGLPVIGNYTSSQIASAIKSVESGGNYTAQGASGEFGAYQFMPGTWDRYSGEYQASQGKARMTLTSTPENQDKVAEFKIQNWLNQGFTADQIAAAWNSGEGNLGADYTQLIGTNKQGVTYNVPKYVNRVLGVLKTTPSAAEDFSSIVNSAVSLATTKFNQEAIRKDLTSALGKSDYITAFSILANNVENALTGTPKTKFADSRTDIGVLQGMRNAIQSYADGGGDMSYLIGKEEDIKRKLGIDSGKATTLAVQLWREFQTYRLNMTGAAFSPAESKDYAAVNPTLGKSINLNLSVIDGAISQLENRVVSTINARVPGSDKIYDQIKGTTTGQFSVLAPDGNTYTFASQEELDNFKKEANIK